MFASTKFALPTEDDEHPLAAPPPWFEPADKRPRLRVDGAVDRIKKLPETELITRDIRCPYYAGRCAAANAASKASAALSLAIIKSDDPLAMLNPREEGRYFRDVKKDAEKLSKAMREFITNRHGYKIGPIGDRIATSNSPDIGVNLHRTIGIAQAKVADAADALDGVTKIISQMAPLFLPKGAQGDPWSITFVTILGLFYRRLTGENPSYSAPFINLVNDAFLDLGGGHKDTDWESPIKTAISRMNNGPKGQGWNRYERPIAVK